MKRWVMVHIASEGCIYRAHQDGEWVTAALSMTQAVDFCEAEGLSVGQTMQALGTAVCDLNSLGDINGQGRWREFNRDRQNRAKAHKQFVEAMDDGS